MAKAKAVACSATDGKTACSMRIKREKYKGAMSIDITLKKIISVT